MRKIIDEVVLFLYGTGILAISCLNMDINVNAAGLGRDVESFAVVAFLLACIYMCLNLVWTDKRIHYILTVGYMMAGICRQEMWMFLPVILYNMLEFYSVLYAVFGAGLTAYVCVVYADVYGIQTVFFTLAGVAATVLLQRRTEAMEKLEQEYKKSRDDSKELTLMLEKKNQNLLEKQDTEIYMATLKERNRIAREIHDNVGHMLSRAILMVGALKTVNQKEQLKIPMEQLEQTLNEAMTSVRKSVHDLHDESVNLKEVLESLAEEFTFCTVRMDYDMGYDIPKEIKYSFIAIVKEALNNVMRHSNATEVHVLVREHPWLYQLIIEDNGTMGENEVDIAESDGIGIQNMKERVRMLQGTMQVQKQNGFRIFITIPKQNV